jgi:soluble lytic murein transglycosylase-like protein
MDRFSRALAVAGLLLSVGALVSYGQTYTYLDEKGVRIYTNIPPKSSVRELVVRGAPSPSAAPATGDKASPSTKYDPIIKKYAGEFRLDPSLVRSMIAKESGFNPKAISHKGAQGLMQLMPATAARIGVQNPLDPEENIRGGMKHMRSLMDTFDNDLVLSLAAYNAGENLVQRIGRVPNYRETHDYIRTITKKYGRTEMMLQPEPARPPSLFRFTDGKGVLHLTNIPPVQRDTAR